MPKLPPGLMACDSVIAKAAPDLSPEDREHILGAIVRRDRQRGGEMQLEGPELRWSKAARELSEEQQVQAAVRRRAQQIDRMRAQKVDAFLAARQGKEAAAIDALNVGSERQGQGNALSVDAQARGLHSLLLGPVIRALREANLLPFVRRMDEAMERDVARELWLVNGWDLGASSGNKVARKIAEILSAGQEASRNLLNEHGAWIGRELSYIVRQSHDALAMRRAGFEAWREAILPKLDDRTFADLREDTPAAREAMLKNIYNNLVSGNHHYAAPGGTDPLAGFQGPGNLARKLSEGRVLHFKGPDEWLDYNKAFGRTNLMGASMQSLEHAARSAALMRVWGTNPEAAFKGAIQRAADAARDRGDFASSEALGGVWRQRYFDAAAGALNIPLNQRFAAVGSTIRAWMTTTKLGGVVLSALPDVAVRASTLRHEGVPLFHSYARSLSDLLEGTPTGIRGEVADHLTVGLNGLLGGLWARTGIHDHLPGRAARMVDLFMKLNLQTQWTDAHQRGVGLMLSENIGNNLGRPWEAINERLRNSLERYGITPADWQKMRDTPAKLEDGRAYFTADMVADPDVQVKMAAYMAETTANALTMTGARERALVTLGTRPGDALGEALRLFTQFKNYSVTFATRHIGRELYREGAADKAGLATLIASTTLLGFASLTLKDLARGKYRDPQDTGDYLKLIGASLAQGGGMGIYGDFLFAEYNRFGGGFTDTLAGPAFGTMKQFMGAFATALRGPAEDDPEKAFGNAGAQLLRAGIDSVPFVNLFYTRMALDYLVLYRLQEAANPGFLRRMERRIERENAQHFVLPPSQVVTR